MVNIFSFANSIEFLQVATLVRDDMLGFQNTIPTRKIAKRIQIEPEELELAFEALKYLILHIAKTNSTTFEDSAIIYE